MFEITRFKMPKTAKLCLFYPMTVQMLRLKSTKWWNPFLHFKFFTDYLWFNSRYTNTNYCNFLVFLISQTRRLFCLRILLCFFFHFRQERFAVSRHQIFMLNFFIVRLNMNRKLFLCLLEPFMTSSSQAILFFFILFLLRLGDRIMIGV